MSTSEHYLLAYGSLLSRDSRQRHSNIQGSAIPVTVTGWQRGWHTRSWGEKQTYVGAVSQHQARMNGVLLPVAEIDPELQQREQDYQFVNVCLSRISFQLTAAGADKIESQFRSATVWLCQSRELHHADEHHPVYQSYIDTCLAGCLEASGNDFASEFIASTLHWDTLLLNDRQRPRYPRAAQLSNQTREVIDQLLEAQGIQPRQEDTE